MRYKNKGFTIIEILTVLAVMAILVGVLLPALTTARNAARQAKQRVQFVSIEQALLAWRNNFGEYPLSNWDSTNPDVYCGAQRLAEALLGWDLLGFHPKSVWRADGTDGAGIDVYYKGINQTLLEDNLAQRKPRYLELETANAFKIKDLFTKRDLFSEIAANTYVLCDEFGRYKVTIGQKTVTAGMPILYYKADPSKIIFTGAPQNCIYNSFDNFPLVLTAQMDDRAKTGSPTYPEHPLSNPAWLYSDKYKIRDMKISRPWPHRPDSYILISAGIDGLYGTADDITNFGN